MGNSSAKKLNTLVQPRPVKRRFERIKVSCEAVLAFPHRQAHARLKAHIYQVARGGCAVSARERPFIGESCIVWALGNGQRYLGVRGHVVWIKPAYEELGAENGILIGIEFDQPIQLSDAFLKHLGRKD